MMEDSLPVYTGIVPLKSIEYDQFTSAEELI